MPGREPNAQLSGRTIDPQILNDPLGFLHTEIYRQTVACNTLEAVASSETNGDSKADAERLRRYIVEDLPIHICDLEECLFPVLATQPLPADTLDHVLARYRNIRERRDNATGVLVSVLGEIAHGDFPPPDFAAAARTFVETWRGILAAESGEILPLAERCITGGKLLDLGQAMAVRRGAPDRN